MPEAEYIDKIIKALQQVPEKKLLIIELVNSIPIKNGALDAQFLADKQTEINLAIAEAKSYGSHTIMAVDALVRLRAEEED